MPHHPSEETAPDNLTDKVAQHSRDSMASDHPLHDENKGPVESATANDFKSKGPQIVENMPAAEGDKAELKAKAEKMNEGN